MCGAQANVEYSGALRFAFVNSFSKFVRRCKPTALSLCTNYICVRWEELCVFKYAPFNCQLELILTDVMELTLSFGVFNWTKFPLFSSAWLQCMMLGTWCLVYAHCVRTGFFFNAHFNSQGSRCRKTIPFNTLCYYFHGLQNTFIKTLSSKKNLRYVHLEFILT